MRDDIFHAIDALRNSGSAYAVATVVETVGSVSAKTGSKAVIDHSGRIVAGWVGGGCAESATCEQALACIEELGLDRTKTNVNGGAIALGHPLGCTGARLMVSLRHEMRRQAAAGERMRYGLATLCVGVGQGCATIVERQ